MFKTTLLSSLLAFSLLLTACSSDKDKENSTAKANALLAKNQIVLTATDKKQYVLKKNNDGFILENSKAKILILDIFATWCPPCQAEASHLSSLQKKFKNEIKVIGVSIEQKIPNEKLELFAKEHKADYTLVNSSQNQRLINDIAKKLKIGNNFGIPLLVLYKDGKLLKYYQGAVEEEFIESDIKRALGI
jgi:thiol-disulfide isomerase/thioredoxin